MTTAPPATLFGRLCSVLGLFVAIGLGFIAFTRLPPAPAPAATGLVPAGGFSTCDIAGGGYWRGSVHGGETLSFDWRDGAFECDGNARPGDRGLRLFFAGRPGGSEHRLMLVIGVSAALPALQGAELPVNVTLIDEASSSFFHSSGDRCFARFDEVAASRAPVEFRVAGELYCAGSVPAVAGPGSVTLGDMAFAGRLALEPAP